MKHINLFGFVILLTFLNLEIVSCTRLVVSDNEEMAGELIVDETDAPIAPLSEESKETVVAEVAPIQAPVEEIAALPADMPDVPVAQMVRKLGQVRTKASHVSPMKKEMVKEPAKETMADPMPAVSQPTPLTAVTPAPEMKHVVAAAPKKQVEAELASADDTGGFFSRHYIVIGMGLLAFFAAYLVFRQRGKDMFV